MSTVRNLAAALTTVVVILPLAVAIVGCGGGAGGTVSGDTPDVDLLSGSGAMNGYVYVPISRAGSRAIEEGVPQLLGEVPADTDLTVWHALVAATITLDTGQVAMTNHLGAYWVPGVPTGTRSATVVGEDPLNPGVDISANFTLVVENAGTSSGGVTPSNPVGTTGSINGYAKLVDNGATLELSASAATGDVFAVGAELSLETGQTATVDTYGFYVLPGIAPGEHTLTITYGDLSWSFTVTVTAGLTSSGSGLLATDWGACWGYIGTPLAAQTPPEVWIMPDATMINPVAGAVVTIDGGASVVTLSTGAYGFTGVPPGVHSLTVTTSTGATTSGVLIVKTAVVTLGLDAPAASIGRIRVSSPATNTVAPSATLQLVAEAWDPNNVSLPGFDTYAWTSSDTGIALVDQRGRVTGVSDGTSDITASAGGASGSFEVTVKTGAAPAVVSVTVSAPNTIVGIAGTLQLSATVLDSEGTVVTGLPIQWTSDTHGTALVSATGLVTGVAPGAATISATTSGITGTLAITCEDLSYGLTATPSSVTFADTDTALTVAIAGTGTDAGTSFAWAVDATKLPTGITASPLAGAGAATITLTADRTSLAVGTYTGDLVVSMSTSSVTVPITMTVSETTIVITSLGD